MTLRIGRVSIPELPGHVSEVSLNGDQVSIRGRLPIGDEDLTGVRWLREQLRGAVGNIDEPYVPFLWDADDWFDGIVQVTGGDVTIDPGGLTRGWLPYSLSFVRVPDGSLPWVESLVIGAKRVNSHSLGDQASPGGFRWSGPVDIDFRSSLTGIGASVDLPTEDGDLFAMFPATGALPATGRYTNRYTVRPADWYLGASRLQWGGDLRTVVGRHIPKVSTMEPWRVTNSRLRLDGDPTTGLITLSLWNGTTWTTPKAFRLQVDISGTYTDLDSMVSFAVAPNGPQAVTIAVGFGTTGSRATYTGYFTLRRGSQFIDAKLEAPAGNAGRIKVATAEAGTAINDGGTDFAIAATSVDVDGIKYFLASVSAVTLNTASGRLTRTTNTDSWPFAFGLTLEDRLSNADIANNLAKQALHSTGETVTVTGR